MVSQAMPKGPGTLAGERRRRAFRDGKPINIRVFCARPRPKGLITASPPQSHPPPFAARKISPAFASKDDRKMEHVP